MGKKQTLIFIDTETADMNPPTLIQLGYMLVQVDPTHPNGYRTIRTVATVVNHGPNLKMNKHAFAVHGISTEFTNSFGLLGADVLNCLAYDLAIADVMIYHNESFDVRVLKHAATHFKVPALTRLLDQTPSHCTMKTTTGFCGLNNKAGKPKWPKLVELHNELFDCEPDDQHDALGDVRATIKCYFALPDELRWLGGAL